MELILENVTVKTSKLNKNLNNVNYSFENGITFCNGLSGKVLKELLFQERKIDNGIIMVSEESTKKDVGIVGWVTYKDFNKSNINDEVQFLINEYSLNVDDVNQRLIDSLKMAGLNSSYTEVFFSDLSSGELKKVSLALMLFVNPKIMIFDYFDKNLNDGDIAYLNKLIYKLVNSYGKNIIICSDNLKNYLNIVKNIVIFRNGKVVYTGNNKNLYDDDIYKYIDKPDIIDFIEFANEKGHYIEKYTDIKELIKAIYRDVENK